MTSALEKEVITLRQEVLTLQKELAEALTALAQAQATIVELEKKLETLTGTKKPAPPPFVKANKPKKQEKLPRQQRDAQHNHGRRREEPTKFETHRLAVCPDCHHGLTRYQPSHRRQLIDIPQPQPIEVVEHTIEKGWCPHCQTWHKPVLPWANAVGAGRFGQRLTGLVGYMRSILRLPFRAIKQFLETAYQMTISLGELVKLSQKLGQKLNETVDQFKAEARASPHLHMDETGWRQDGQGGYIWCMVTNSPQPIRYYDYWPSRSGAVAEEMLGGLFKGVLVSDFYAAYNRYAGQHQRCWVHLLRDLSALRQEHATDGEIVAWSVGVKNLYYLAREMKEKAKEDVTESVKMQPRLIEMARQFGVLYAQEKHPCRALAKRLLRHMDELFVFAFHPDLDADNNLAERALRGLVVQRKVSGGSRSAEGSKTAMRLATLFQTWQARGLNPLHECWRLLAGQPNQAISI